MRYALLANIFDPRWNTGFSCGDKGNTTTHQATAQNTDAFHFGRFDITCPSFFFHVRGSEEDIP
ncbi:MAG: Uncharacterised protein [Pseudidiomarina mangrovi]|nr:MAG: Uncharacterised protein [Pseudidiomarina mangrovi]